MRRTAAAPAPGGPPGRAPGGAEWHRIGPAEAARRLGSDLERGLDRRAAARRLAAHGPNLLPEAGAPPFWAILAGQFRDVMVLALVAAAGLSLLLGEAADAVAIGAILLLNAALGSIQELRAERSLLALRRLLAPTARVVREGRVGEVPAAEVVPGDVLVLEAGDRVAADARLVEAAGLEADESALTGESVPVPKRASTLGEGQGRSLGDRPNMVYQGTVITRGRGRALVVATGTDTEVGGIAGLIREAGEGPTPLQRRLGQLGRYLVGACLGLAALVTAGGLLRGEPLFSMILTGVSLAVAAIPEGLPAVVTVVLALGTQRMLARRAVIRRLPAVETLGCATVICTDKTGTLTRNEMVVRSLWVPGSRCEVTERGGARWSAGPGEGEPGSRPGDRREDLSRLVEAMVLCNDAPLDGGQAGAAAPRGDPTERALLAAAARAGADAAALRSRFARVAEAPFDPDRKAMSVVCRGPDGRTGVFVKGAPERVLAVCDRVWRDGGARPLTARGRREALEAAAGMAGRALRVLALAWRELSPPEAREVLGRAVARGGTAEPALLEQRLVFLGLAGMMDPPRPEARGAVARCRAAGLRVVMVTGDHALTAAAVARELGIEGEVVTGPELDRMDEAALAAALGTASVFARVSPAHKLRLVRALRRQGEVVAMTGDGVNDAPALKEADIGVAMGVAGTEVTREAADMVLADDDFATIVAAVEEGRAIYENIRKFVRYLLSCNAGEVLVMLGATLLGFPLPLLPIQILLVNLVTDGLPAIALGVDPPERDLMTRPPRDPREGVFARGLAVRIVGRGAVIGAVTLAWFAAALILTGGLERARTLAMAALSGCQLLFAFECRSETRSLLETGFLGNRALLAGVATSVAVLAAVIHVPALQPLFHTVPLSAGEWAAVAGAAVAASALAAAQRAVAARAAAGR